MDEVARPGLKMLIVYAPRCGSAQNEVKLFGIMRMSGVRNMILLEKKAHANRLGATCSVLIDQYRVGVASGKEFRNSPTGLRPRGEPGGSLASACQIKVRRDRPYGVFEAHVRGGAPARGGRASIVRYGLN
jgi:hypothetical protein